MLGLIGRWLKVANMPNSDRDVNRHLRILPRLRRELLRDLYPVVPPQRVLHFAELSLQNQGRDDDFNRPGSSGRKVAKGRGRLGKPSPSRTPSR